MNPSSAAAEAAGRPDVAVATAFPGLATIRLNGTPTPAVLADGFVLPLAEAARRGGVGEAVPASVRAALTDWDRWTPVIRRATDVGGPGWLPEAEVEFLPVLVDPPTVYCAAANYADHTKEMRSTADSVANAPMFFLAPPAALAGHREPIVRPGAEEQLDWEVELAVVIGKRAASVSAADAYTVIAGYTVANDLSVRSLARRADFPFFPDWFAMKAHTGSKPLGPALVPAEFVPEPMDLRLGLTVNGEERQASSTKNMIFDIAEQVEYLSRIVTLQPGDVILTGTPAGTGRAWGTYLSAGDVMVAEIEGLGRLETRVDIAVPAQGTHSRATEGN